MIALREVTKTYGAAGALDGLTLEVEKGASLALVGSSGSGKSTVMRLCTGLERADRGHVEVGGVEVTDDVRSLDEVRKKIGYVIQEGGLFPHLTCRENATVVASRRGMSRADMKARLDELSALTQLSEAVLDRRPGEVSGGQRQRVALVRALFRDPDVMLLDEPFGALDPVVRVALADELFPKLRALGKTVLLVTHDLAEAAATTDTIALLHEGRILQRGTLDELRDHPATPFVHTFVSAVWGRGTPAPRGEP